MEKHNGCFSIYLFIYKCLKEDSVRGIYITHANALMTLKRRFYRIPRMLYFTLLKELEELKLIRRVGNTNNIRYELIGKDIDKKLNDYLIFC